MHKINGKVNGWLRGQTNESSSRQPGQDDGEQTYLPWLFENLENFKTKQVHGSIMKWYSNNFHDKHMWCGRRNCMNCANFASAWKKKKEDKDTNGAPTSSASDEFKIELATSMPPEELSSLQEQFGEIKY